MKKGRLLRPLVSLGILAFLLSRLDTRQFAYAFAHLRIGWWTLAVLICFLQSLASALRWQGIATNLGVRAPVHAFIQGTLAGIFLNQFIPTGIAGDVVRYRFLGVKEKNREVLASLVADRLSLHAAWILWCAFQFGGSVSLGLAMAVILLARTRLAHLVWSLLITFSLPLGFFASAKALGLTLPLGEVFAKFPAVLIAMIVPVTANGWGTREWTIAAIFAADGVSLEKLVAASVAWGAAAMVAALPGLLYITQNWAHSIKISFKNKYIQKNSQFANHE